MTFILKQMFFAKTTFILKRREYIKKNYIMLMIYWPEKCEYFIDHKIFFGSLSTKKI